MRRNAIVLLAFAWVGTATAALPPRYQNMNDLDVMVEYVRGHPVIASSLKSIDLQTLTIHFDSECQAVFGRKSVVRGPGWVGPADPLEFKSANCPVD